MKIIVFTFCLVAFTLTYVTSSIISLRHERGRRSARTWPAEDNRNSIQVSHDDANVVDLQRSFCPVASSVLSCVILSECTYDSDCSSHLKCCENGCGTSACMEPVPLAEEIATCDNHQCPQQGSECSDEGGEVKCTCITRCPEPGRDYICTGNNTMFLSRCLMDMYACNNGITLIPKSCPFLKISSRTQSNGGNSNGQVRPKMLYHPAPQFAKIGDRVIFECSVTGEPHIIWKRSEFMTLPHHNSRVSLTANSRSLIINNVRMSDNGEYKCIAFNNMGSISLTFHLVIQGQGPLKNVEVDRNSYENRCVIDPKTQASRCTDPDRPFQRYWSYNDDLNICQLKTFKDCDAIINKYTTREMCRRSCHSICNLSFDKGRCKIFEVRFYYNSDTGNCENFVYGGCEGNANNFRQRSDCEQRCPIPRPVIAPVPQTCQFCSKNILRTYCRADFVVTGMIRQIVHQSTHPYMEIQLTGVFKDRDNNVGLYSLDLFDPLISNQVFNLKLDPNCPCPNFGTLLQSQHVASNIVKSPRHCLTVNREPGNSDTISRRTASHAPCAEVILSGDVINGIPTITQGSLATLATRKNMGRLNGTIDAPHGACALVANPN